jgi:hypothetical protein
MRTFIILLLLLSFSVNCLAALPNPVEDTIKRDTNRVVDNIVSDISFSVHDVFRDFTIELKDLLRRFFKEVLSIITIFCVGYTFSYLVPKRTAKLMLLVTALCIVNAVIAKLL